MEKTVKERAPAVAAFVKASMQGWKDYLSGDPGAANALIKKDNPNMKDDQLAYAVDKLKQYNFVGGGDAARGGIGVMTDARWKKTYDFMVAAGLLKSGTDWHKAYTTQFVKDAKIMP
jgi:NitT/TauT family transport system substrate-binding protein